MKKHPIRIGARGSKLSLAQSGTVRDAIAAFLGDPDAAELVVITTTGDRVQDRSLMAIGGKALFTKEIELALLEGRIDCAVHSLKDVPAEPTPGLVIAAIPEREDPRDAFISPLASRLEDLPQGARLGAASLRRQAQSRFRRPDLTPVLMRGNVDTRLAKLAAGEADAILLAYAGLKRLGLGDRVAGLLDPVAIPPAPGQGALAVQSRAEDADLPWLAALNHAPSALTVAAERGALEALEGSCRTAIGAHARLEGETLYLVVEALTPDGARCFRREGEARAELERAHALGLELGRAIALEGGEALLAPAE